MRSPWRAGAFLLIVVAAIVLGLRWHRQADEGGPVSVSGAMAPISIGVFYAYSEANPTSLIVETTSLGDRVVSVTMSGYFDDRGGFAVVANRPDVSGLLKKLRPIGVPGVEDNVEAYGYAPFTPVTALDDSHKSAFALNFVVSSRAIVDHDGSVSARLPVVNADFDDPNQLGEFGLIDPAPGGKPASVVLDPPAQSTPAYNSVKGLQLLTYPEDLRVTETLEKLKEPVSKLEVVASSPSGLTEQNRQFLWHGTNGLAPTVEANAKGLVTNQRQYEFLSGIALATGAAAAIALAQELPDSWPAGRRRTREAGVQANSSCQDDAGVADSTATDRDGPLTACRSAPGLAVLALWWLAWRHRKRHVNWLLRNHDRDARRIDDPH